MVAYNYTMGIDFLQNTLTDVRIFQTEYIISIILVLITLAIITRDYNRWGTLALPVMVGWHIIGIVPHLLMYITAAIIFVLNAMSIQTIGHIAEAAIGKTARYTGEMRHGIGEGYKRAKSIPKTFNFKKIHPEKRESGYGVSMPKEKTQVLRKTRGFLGGFFSRNPDSTNKMMQKELEELIKRQKGRNQ